MRILNAVIGACLQVIASIIALLAIPPAFVACVLLFTASIFAALSNARENP